MAYNRTYYYNIVSTAGITYRIEFYDQVASSSFYNVEGTPGKTPFKIKWGTDGSSMFAPLKPSTCTLNFMVTDFRSALYIKQLRTQRQEQDIYVAIYRETVNGNNTPNYSPIWGGFLLMDLSDDPDIDAPFNVTLKAIDGIAALKYYDYVPNTTTQSPDNLYDMGQTWMPTSGVGANNNPTRRTFKQIIADCFLYLGDFDGTKGNPNSPQYVIGASWNNGAFSSTTVEPLSNTRVKPDIFYTSEEITDDITKYKPKTCYDVLKAVCKGWGMRLFYWRNKYYFIQINEFNNGQIGTQASPNDIKNYRFNMDGSTVGSSNTIQGFWGTYQLYMDSEVDNRQIKWRKKAGGQYGILPAFKKVTVDFLNVDNVNRFTEFPPIPPTPPASQAVGSQYTFRSLGVYTFDGLTDQHFFNRIYLDIVNNSGYTGKIEVNWGLWARPVSASNPNTLNASPIDNDWKYFLQPDPTVPNGMTWKFYWSYSWGGQPYFDQWTVPPGNSTIEITDSPTYSTIPQFPYFPAPSGGVLDPFTAGDWELGYYVDSFCTTVISAGVTYTSGAWQFGGMFKRQPANAGGISGTVRSPHFWNVSWNNVAPQQGIGASEFAPITNGSIGSASTTTSLVQTGDDTAFQNIKDIIFGDTLGTGEGGVQVYTGSAWVDSDVSGIWGIDTLSGSNSMSQQLATDIISAQSRPIHKFTVSTILDPEKGWYFNDGSANRPQYPFPGTKWFTLAHGSTATPSRKWIMHTCEFDVVEDTWKWVLYEQELKDTTVTTTTTTTGGWNTGHTGGWDIPHDDDMNPHGKIGNPAAANTKAITELIYNQDKPLTTIVGTDGKGYPLPYTGWDGTGDMPGPASQTITSLIVDKIDTAVLKTGNKINVLIRNLKNESQFTPSEETGYDYQAQYPYCLTFTVNSDQEADATTIEVESTTIYQSLEAGARVVLDTRSLQEQVNSNTVSGTINTVAKFTAANTIGNSEITDTGSVIKLGSDSSSQETLYINTDNRTVGFRTQTPESAMDVNGTLRARNELNVGNTNEQNFFVAGGTGAKYVKMGAYTKAANFLGIASNENLLKTTAGFGLNGKLVQASRFYTTKISPATSTTSGGWPTGAGLTNGINITPTPNTNQVMFIRSILVRKEGTVGSGWSTNHFSIEFGWKTTGGAVTDRFIGGIPRQTVICTNPLDWWYQVALNPETNNAYGTPHLGPANAYPLKLSTPSVISSQKQPTMYIQVEYTLVNAVNLRTNVDQTLT